MQDVIAPAIKYVLACLQSGHESRSQGIFEIQERNGQGQAILDGIVKNWGDSKDVLNYSAGWGLWCYWPADIDPGI